ncbi:MAG TPA: RsmE family RNA methyltransferase [Puia sp.]|nr:RsmE family RNA methyltransferase [Puia sp.]
MALPYFYLSKYDPADSEVELDEEASKHIVQVLRMKPADPLQLTDGKGNVLDAEVLRDNKKKCLVKLTGKRFIEKEPRSISIGISLLKNASRFEWFLEKATEIGVTEIIPLLCSRTEKHHVRIDRLKSILISALLQSKQVWLPELHEPLSFTDSIHRFAQQQKFIAHCEEKGQRNLSDLINPNVQSRVILIGPEGDFTREEITLALEHTFLPVSLGPSRLRSETAGIVAVTLLNVKS